MKYLYAMMDDQTGFWIAQEVADTKYSADIRPLFKLGKAIAGKQPKTIITDGTPNFHEAFMDEYWTRKLATRPQTHQGHNFGRRTTQQQNGKDEWGNSRPRADYADTRKA
jgi:hypothetical protein